MTMTDRVMIFDVDGTLVDSNDAHARAWVEALAHFDIHVETAAVRRLIGMGSDKLLPELIAVEAESPRGQEIDAARGELFRREYLPHLRPFPATRALFQALKSEGIRLAVASSSREEDLGRLLEIAEVADLVERRASAKDAKRSKPDPDVIHAALEQLGGGALAGAAIGMVGDTPYDVAAAWKAGVRPLAFRCGGWSDADLSGAAFIFDGPEDMLARLSLAVNAVR